MPDPVLAVKKIINEDWKFLEEKLNNADLELKSFMVFNFDVAKINRVLESIRQAKKGTKNLFNTGITFSSNARKNLGIFYAELRKIIDELIKELESLIEELKKGTSISVQDKIQEVNKQIETLSFKISDFMHTILTSVSRIAEMVKNFDCHRTCFVNIAPARDEYLVPFFYVISHTTRSLQIMTPYIDETHLRFLAYLKDCHNQQSFNLRLLLRSENPARKFLKNKELPWFEVKINYNIHARMVISDKKLVMISSTDLKSITYAGHFEAGVITYEAKVVSLCYDFFEKAWKRGTALDVFDHPLDRSKLIVQHDSKKLAVCSEVAWAIQPVDPSYCFRIVTKKWGYIDSGCPYSRLNKAMKDFPDFRHISFFSPILRIIPLDIEDSERLSALIFEVLRCVIERGATIDLRFYDLEKEKIISNEVLEKIKKHLMERHCCSFSEKSKNRIIVFLHKNKYIVTFTEWETSPI